MTKEELLEEVTARTIVEISLAGKGLDDLAMGFRTSGAKVESHRELGAGLAWFGDMFDLLRTLGLATEALSKASQRVLRELVAAQQIRDDLLVADLLQYELKPLLLERIAPMLSRFAER